MIDISGIRRSDSEPSLHRACKRASIARKPGIADARAFHIVAHPGQTACRTPDRRLFCGPGTSCRSDTAPRTRSAGTERFPYQVGPHKSVLLSPVFFAKKDAIIDCQLADEMFKKG
jgi:hypothetical protein